MAACCFGGLQQRGASCLHHHQQQPQQLRQQHRAAPRSRRAARVQAVVQEPEAASSSSAPVAPTPGAADSGAAASTSGRRLTTAEWRAKYERDGAVDLFLIDDFNAALVLGRTVGAGSRFGIGTGEGASKGDCAKHKVQIYNHYADEHVELEVPEDRYILWEAEDQGFDLPYACRMGCCTACAVKVKEGRLYQPEALGVSEELKRAGYALMCVAYPETDVVLETVAEDAVYDLQFGRSFAAQALDKNSQSVERDDFAIEIAMGDE